MNRSSHRLIYNAPRRCVMAVADTARNAGKASGATRRKRCNTADLRGATLTAPQINFTKTDPNKAGTLILGGSVDTTQTAHTEKSETAGLYQSSSGSGSTTQTLNQTKLNGNVTFDQ